MGTYNNRAKEIAEVINDALTNIEGDFSLVELELAFDIVRLEQREIQLGY